MLIQNGEINLQATKELNNMAVTGGLRDMSGITIPVYPVQPRYTPIVRAFSSTGSGSSTVYTVTANKVFNLTYMMLNYSKDAASDCTLIRLTVTTGGATRDILAFTSQTLTAETNCVAVALPFPIQIDPGTNILLQSTFTVGTMTRRCAIGGFEI